MRRLATPQAVRDRSNPAQPTPEVIGQALEHYADHCASCHANDGSGDTAIGRSLYPRVPDMRADQTQSLTDGELFSIIEHSIRLTGMPAWGDGTPGIQGLAPYWCDIEATAYIGASGRTHARFEVEYELLLTNRLIAQPLFEAEVFGKCALHRRHMEEPSG